MITVKDIATQNEKEKDLYFIHLRKERKDRYDPLIIELWSGWLKDIPEKYMEYEVLEAVQSLRDWESGITGFYLEIRDASKVKELII